MNATSSTTDGTASRAAGGSVRVGYSSRLGPITDMERDTLSMPGVELVELDLTTMDAIVSASPGLDYLVIGAIEPFDRRTLEAMDPVRMIVRRGAGYDNVDIAAASERRIAVVNVPDASVEEVSDHALALALTLARRIPIADRLVRRGQSGRARMNQEAVLRFSEMVVGIVGLGRIGRRCAQKATALFGEVVGTDPVRESPRGVRSMALDELLACSDIVSLHVPLTTGTRHLIDAERLSRLKHGAVLVNTSRGEVIDEKALAAALGSGRVGGAGLDVLSDDPPSPDDPLLGFDNVVVTAHTAGRGVSASRDLRVRSIGAVADALRGHRPPSILNPHVWPSASVEHPDADPGPTGHDDPGGSD